MRRYRNVPTQCTPEIRAEITLSGKCVQKKWLIISGDAEFLAGLCLQLCQLLVDVRRKQLILINGKVWIYRSTRCVRHFPPFFTRTTDQTIDFSIGPTVRLDQKCIVVPNSVPSAVRIIGIKRTTTVRSG